jgi:hypothetical protein
MRLPAARGEPRTVEFVSRLQWMAGAPSMKRTMDRPAAAPPAAAPVGRCWWAGSDPVYVDYHDREWGFPVKDDRRLFEKICLEGFQAGLSWRTILYKRDAFREGFANF